jgi:hypothetical protein
MIGFTASYGVATDCASDAAVASRKTGNKALRSEAENAMMCVLM